MSRWSITCAPTGAVPTKCRHDDFGRQQSAGRYSRGPYRQLRRCGRDHLLSCLVAIFTHWSYPLLIMTTIPLGVAGGIVGLWLMNELGALLPLVGLQPFSQSFDMIAMLGFLILMGTVVNNPILIVHQAMNNVRRHGMDARKAVRDAVETRLRPIAMSTLTTAVGLAPLVFLPGEGAELYRGVGAIVMFGLLGTAVISLTFLPALTVTVLGWRRPASTTSDKSAKTEYDAAVPLRRSGTV